MKIFFAFIVFLLAGTSYSQELRIGIGYSNLYSQQFDRLIQTYNFSRPFLDEKQPLLDNGIHSSLSYLFQSEKNLKSGIAVDYSLFKSTADNPNLNSKIAFNMLELGYLLYFENTDKFGNFYSELEVSAVFGLLNKKQNNETYMIDDKAVRSFQVGGSLHLNIGYLFELSNKLKISPFIGLNYAPYFSEGRSEIVINQTSDLIDEEEQYSSFLKFDVGLRLHLFNN
jgi:hypothetical protein